jgi:hypothetical protein
MQHHRVRTRLLDWAESFGVALYFALYDIGMKKNIKEWSPCIWLLNPYAVDEIYHNGRDLWDPEFLEEYDEEVDCYSRLLMGHYEEYKGGMFSWNEQILKKGHFTFGMSAGCVCFFK